jgi:N-acetyl-gamma-glutamyl-phosphate reductase
MIQVGIIGGAGYTGGETIRILLHHPEVKIKFVHSRSHAGVPIYKVHTDLIGDTEVLFSSIIYKDIDVLFICLGHGESLKFLKEHNIPNSIKVIDLSQDFRINTEAVNRHFVYGLPELNKKDISLAQNITNPGCFATAIQLALLPLAQNNYLTASIHTTGITGATGAGQKMQATTQHSWRNNNTNAYKTLSHQHMLEINAHLQPNASLHFVPWRGDFNRGIFTTSYTQSTLSLEQTISLYQNYYKDSPFTHLADEMIDVKMTVNTNKCLLFIEKEGDQIIIHSAIDNLIKGAAGQAIQNMNIMLDLHETTGLHLKSVVF